MNFEPRFLCPGYIETDAKKIYWLKISPLIKNPQFSSTLADIQAKLPTHEVVILTKFHKDCKKIVDFLFTQKFLVCTLFYASPFRRGFWNDVQKLWLTCHQPSGNSGWITAGGIYDTPSLTRVKVFCIDWESDISTEIFDLLSIFCLRTSSSLSLLSKRYSFVFSISENLKNWKDLLGH